MDFITVLLFTVIIALVARLVLYPHPTPGVRMVAYGGERAPPWAPLPPFFKLLSLSTRAVSISLLEKIRAEPTQRDPR